MLNPIVSYLVIQCEMLICYIFYSTMFEKRFSAFKCLGIGWGFYSLCSVANLLSGNHGLVNLSAAVLINMLFGVYCFECSWKLSTFYAVILCAVNGAIETGVVSVVSAVTGNDIFAYNQNLPLLLLECSTSKILYFCMAFLISKMVRRKVSTAKLSFNLLLYPSSTVVCQIVFWYINISLETSYTTQLLLAISSLLLLVSTILLFVTYQQQIEKDRDSLLLKSAYEKLQTEKSYYDILEAQNEHLMMYAHDAKNHLEAIRSLNRDTQIDNYVIKLSEQLTQYSRGCHSGNILLDVMIHKYCVECEKRGIRFVYDVKLCNLKNIEDMDLVTILGNLIDNAVTAAEKSSLKMVSLETAKRNAYEVIIVSNSCDTPPKEMGGRLVTTKDDQNPHGYGLCSVKKTLKKYAGDFAWIYSEAEKTFTVTVMLKPI